MSVDARKQLPDIILTQFCTEGLFVSFTEFFLSIITIHIRYIFSYHDEICQKHCVIFNNKLHTEINLRNSNTNMFFLSSLIFEWKNIFGITSKQSIQCFPELPPNTYLTIQLGFNRKFIMMISNVPVVQCREDK